MHLRLPRSKRIANLPPLIGGALTHITTLAAPTHGLLHALHPTQIHATPDQLTLILTHLTTTKHLLQSPTGTIAVTRLVSAKLHSEKIAAKKRKTPENRPFRDLIAHHFPHLVSTKPRSPGYVIPQAFLPLLKAHENHHLDRCPPDVERITEAFYPTEIQAIVTALHEQTSAHRTPILLYTRKALYLALRRTPKR
jgi:hypothetical protein